MNRTPKVGQTFGVFCMAKYSDEFKLEVVLYCLDGRSFHETARHFNLDHSIVIRWVKLYQTHGIDSLRRKSSKAVYVVDFKQTAVLRLLAGESVKALAVELNLNYSILYQWLKAYNQYGIMGLYPKPKGRIPVSTVSDKSDKARKSNKARLSWQDKADADKTADELLAELAYMRAENAYLKKLDALIRQRQQSKPKTKR